MSEPADLTIQEQINVAKINELGLDVSELVRDKQKQLNPAECLCALAICVAHICRSSNMSHEYAANLIRDMLEHVKVGPKPKKRQLDA